MTVDERVLRLENAMAALAELSAEQQRRVSRLEESFVVLIELVRRHDERIDELAASQADRVGELSAAQADSERKIATLAGAQTRTEEKFVETDERLNVLIGTVERFISEGRGGKG